MSNKYQLVQTVMNHDTGTYHTNLVTERRYNSLSEALEARDRLPASHIVSVVSVEVEDDVPALVRELAEIMTKLETSGFDPNTSTEQPNRIWLNKFDEGGNHQQYQVRYRAHAWKAEEL